MTHLGLRSTLLALIALTPVAAAAQSEANLAALRGLSPVSRLLITDEGRAALAANLSVTHGIQTGATEQPLLMPFPQQQLQALRDAFISDGNATQLADGLGTRLGEVYQGKLRVEKDETFSSVSKSVADLIGYTNAVTKSDSNAGKYFFANGTKDGKEPVSPRALAILSETGGTTDVFGKAYGRPAGTLGSDANGNARPFQTAPNLVSYRGPDYFDRPSHSLDWLRGPISNYLDSPSYPSGHTTYGYTESVLLAILVPERYQQMVARAAEYGNDRIILGAHYAMDVLGGRALSLHAIAHLLANDPNYVGRTLRNPAVLDTVAASADRQVTIADYPAAVRAARAEMIAFLESGCGGRLPACAADDTGRFKDPATVEAFYAATQTYGLPVVHRTVATAKLDVGAVAPEAGHLLTAAFPKLTLAEANAILTETLGPGGGFLDDGSAFGLYSRLNLYAAGSKAAATVQGR